MFPLKLIHLARKITQGPRQELDSYSSSPEKQDIFVFSVQHILKNPNYFFFFLLFVHVNTRGPPSSQNSVRVQRTSLVDTLVCDSDAPTKCVMAIPLMRFNTFNVAGQGWLRGAGACADEQGLEGPHPWFNILLQPS